MKIVLLTLSLTLMIVAGWFGVTAQSSKVDDKKKSSDFQISGLTAVGQTAYQKLAAAERFEEGYLGEGAEPSELVLAFYDLTREPAAREAFAALIENGKMPGQLYGLIGLYKFDRELFDAAIKKYRSNDEYVDVASGCLTMPEKISKLIDSSDKPYHSHDILSGKYTEYFIGVGERIATHKKK